MRPSIVAGSLALLVLAAARHASAEIVDELQKALDGKSLPEARLVPRGFVEIARAKGDLDGDGSDDVALIVKRDPKGKKAAKDGSEGDDSDVQPVVLFVGDGKGAYAWWYLSAKAFTDDNSSFMEPHGLGVFQIKKGVLTIGTSMMMSAGSWSTTDCTSKWRNGPAGLQLIGLTTSTIDRSCACGSDSDTNFLTGVTISTTDSADGKQLKKPRKVKTREKPKTILWEDFDYDEMCSG